MRARLRQVIVSPRSLQFLRVCVAALWIASIPLAAQGLPDREGPLDNDVFLPTSRQAEELLERGDVALAEAQSPPELLKVFESWRSALTASETGAAVTRSDRDTLGVEAAVWHRLLALGADRQAQWSERFEGLAREELRVAGRALVGLARVERRNPGTSAAILACLRLADFEFERGGLVETALWCHRARRHLELPNLKSEELMRAIDTRLEIAQGLKLSPVSGVRAPKFGKDWESATSLRYLSRVDFRKSLLQTRSNGASTAGPPGGTEAGLALLEDGRIAIQSSRRVTIVTATGASIESSFEPALLLPDAIGMPPDFPRYSDERHRPLIPTAAAGGLILVHGRPARIRGGENALMSVRPPSSPPALGASRPGLPVLNWAIVGNRRVDSEGRLHFEPKLEALPSVLFQNGPIVIGTRVFVSLQHSGGDVRSWLACFDLGSGECLWTRLLAQGSGLQPGDDGRGARRLPNSAQPLAATDTHIFVGTGLGAGLLVDVLDGRLLWGFANRRRAAGNRGWTTNWAPTVSTTAPHTPAILWTPIDSDHEYLLSGDPNAHDGGPLLRAPREIGEALALIGGDREHSIALTLAGSRRVVSSRRNRDGARFDSPYLGREEAFGGSAAISESRVLFATDRGLYLLDRPRELYLLDYEPIPDQSSPLGASVRARGSRIFVLGRASLWTFLAN